MAPSNIKLMYFNGRGRAEQIRWILAQSGETWEDKRIEQADWPALKPKTPMGSLPYMESDGCTVATSGAIALYLAKEFGLLGCNNLEAAQNHMIWEAVQDTLNTFGKATLCTDKEQQATMFKDYYTACLPKLIKLMACKLKDKDWMVGGKLSMADLVTVCYLDCVNDEAGFAAIKAEPGVAKHICKIKELPNIKKWIENRPASDW